MKKFILLFLFMSYFLFSDAQTWSAYRGKTLYLASYGSYDSASNSCNKPLVCRFGEYIKLGTNGVLSWNSRLGGDNSSYTYSLNGKRMNLKSRNRTNEPDQYIEIIRVQGNNVQTRSSDGVYRVFSLQRQRVVNGPGAEITSFTIEHNAYRNNQKGLVVHVDVQFFYVNNHNLRVSAYFDSPENNGLQDKNGQYRGYNGVICTESNITNNGDYTSIQDLQLFLPYSELHLGGGSHDVACHVYVHDRSLGDAGYYLTKSDFIHLTYNAPADNNFPSNNGGRTNNSGGYVHYDNSPMPCVGCGGTKKCSVCNGKGYTVSASSRRMWHECGACNGTGICQSCRFQ